MSFRRFAASLGVATWLFAPYAFAQSDSNAVRPARIFSDGLVLQRHARIPVWGWASPGTRVSVAFNHQRRAATTDPTGAWRVSFPPMKAGGPYDITISSGIASQTIRDILVGDVWVASGQSNMEWPVGSSDSAQVVIARANDPAIREFAVPHSYSDKPEREVVGGSWAHADREHVGRFSGVAYFFARDLRKSINVPIGIIHTSWGGANIETWMSREANGLSDNAWLALVEKDRLHNDSIRTALRARIGGLPTVDSGLTNGVATWADPRFADQDWATLQTPSLWENVGYNGLDGVAWYRTSFTLSADDVRQTVRMSLGSIDDADITWVNGVEIGRTNGYAEPRLYAIPNAALREGTNVLAVRVQDGGGGGGIYGTPAQVYLEVGGVRRSIAGSWRFRVGAVSFQPDGQVINKVPSVLYNRMINPLLGFPIRGVLWYQGESNSNNVQQATNYRAQFRTLITSWRKAWSLTPRDFPFLWVQLPNYGGVDPSPPPNAGWASVRESQAAALELPNTGQVVAIDLGFADELHPRNKQPVGARLALEARAVAYGERLVSSGPTYRRHTIRGDRVVVEFANLGGGLVSRTADGRLPGFAIAGADQRWVWADAALDGNRVVVWSNEVQQPAGVRYLWSNSPTAPALYNREGLPAAPFRTDTWR